MEDCDRDDQRRLIDRLAHLERQNKRLSWAVGVLAALGLSALTGVTIAAPKPSSVVAASQFVLKDAEGFKRGELVIDHEGNGRFALYGQDGQITAELPFRQQNLPIRH